jgi:hypothetical protein
MSLAGIAEAILRDIAEDERKRLKHIEAAWDAYFGKVEKPLVIDKDTGYDDNLVLPLPRVIVDVGRSYLFGRDLAFEVRNPEKGTGDSEGRGDAAQTFLDAVWAQNNQDALLQSVSLSGGIGGHSFIKVRQEQQGLRRFRLINLNPVGVRVQWEPDDFESVQKFIIEWTTVKTANLALPRVTAHRQVIERAENGQSWEVIDSESQGDVSSWTETVRETWPYRWPPIVECQNLPTATTFYGVSDLEPDVLEACRGVNFMLSNLNRILRFHAHPKVILEGAEPDILDVAIDETISLPPGAKLHIVAPQVDIASTMGLLEKTVEMVFQTSRIPEVALGRLDKAGPVSGVALEIVYRPIVEKTNDKRRLYGEMLSTLNGRLLELGGFGAAEEMEVETIWPDILPKDALSEAQVAVAKQGAGVSKATTLAEMGYDPDQEAEDREEEGSSEADALRNALQRPIV